MVGTKVYRGSPRKPPGGWGFCTAIFGEASLNKNPTPIFFSFLAVFITRELSLEYNYELGCTDISKKIGFEQVSELYVTVNSPL